MQLHHSILEESGVSGAQMAGLGGGNGSGNSTDGMLLLNENEAELVNAHSPGDFGVEDGSGDEELGSSRRASSSGILITPIRTGKRGRPPGSTTGSAAKRIAQQAEEVRNVIRFVHEMGKQMREMREALASVVETQTNHSAVLAVLQQQLSLQHGEELMMPLVKKLNKGHHHQQEEEMMDENEALNH